MLVLLRFGAGVPIGTWYSGQILHGPDSRCMVDHKDARCWSPVRISRQAILNQRTLSVIMESSNGLLSLCTRLGPTVACHTIPGVVPPFLTYC
jgi:hypothetical protein